MRLWQTGQSVFVRSPAKLNLFLEIHGRRSDGYHELETLMVPVAVTDTLSFETEDSNRSHLTMVDAGTLARGSTDRVADIPAGPENLILKAVSAVQDYTGVNRQVRITAWKRIPPASGMAGGSGNAAATLLGLNRFWDLGLTRADLMRLGASLGSDVSFFLAGGRAAVCRGRGERIEPVPFPDTWYFVIVRPLTGLSTSAVYGRWKPISETREPGPLLHAVQRGLMSRAARLFHNALQKPAEELNTDVARLRRLFAGLPLAGHLMTGSGTGYFGVCGCRRVANRIATRLRSVGAGRVFVTRNTTL